MNSKLQNTLIIIGIVAIAGIGYYLYEQNSVITLQGNSVDNTKAVETADFLQRLNELKVITLDGVILQDERFKTLVDSSQVIVPVSVGRKNPFAARN